MNTRLTVNKKVVDNKDVIDLHYKTDYAYKTLRLTPEQALKIGRQLIEEATK